MGITATITDLLASVVGPDIAAVAAPAVVDAGIGAGGGAALGAVTGGNPATDALTGAIGGAGVGLGPAFGAATGVGTTAGTGITGAASGALGAGVTGQNPLVGAALGGVSGLATGAFGGDTSAPDTSVTGATTTAPVTPATPTAGTTSTTVPTATSAPAIPGAGLAGAPAAPAGVGAGGESDLFSLNTPTGAASNLPGTTTPQTDQLGPLISGGGNTDLSSTLSSSGSAIPSAPPANLTGASGATPTSGSSGGLLSQISSLFGGGPSLPTNLSGSTGTSGSSSTLTEAPSTVPANLTGGTSTNAATPPGGSLSAFLNNPGLSTAGNVLSSNAGALIPAAGLGYSLLNQGAQPANYSTLKGEASTLAGQGSTLSSYLQTGTLPAGVEASLTQASDSAKAAIRSQYASMGLSGSSSEAQSLASVDQTIAAEGSNIATNLLQQGVSETNMASAIYQQLMQTQLAQDQQLSGAIQNFGTALAGGSGGGQTITLKAS